MLKIKIAAIIGVLFLIAVVSGSSEKFSSSAKGEAIEEIVKYKTWTRISKEPIAVKIDEAALVGG